MTYPIQKFPLRDFAHSEMKKGMSKFLLIILEKQKMFGLKLIGVPLAYLADA